MVRYLSVVSNAHCPANSVVAVDLLVEDQLREGVPVSVSPVPPVLQYSSTQSAEVPDSPASRLVGGGTRCISPGSNHTFIDHSSIDVRIVGPDGKTIHQGERESNGKYIFAAHTGVKREQEYMQVIDGSWLQTSLVDIVDISYRPQGVFTL